MSLDLLGLDELHSAEEREIRSTVRRFLDDQVRPHVAGWYEDGRAPVRELAGEFGKLGLLGMHLTGYGCAGASAVAYGLACLELEAAPRMATGEAIGCFGLTEPDHGSDPASMSTRARRVGDDWVIDGTKMWITNAPVASVAVIWARGDDGVLGFLVPTDAPGFAAGEVRHKLSLRASSTGEIVLDGVRLPEAARLPEACGLRAPLSCLTEARHGIVWGALGAARDCLTVTLDYARSREQFGRPIAGFQLTQAKLADMAVEWHKGYLLALHLGRRADAGTLTPEQVSVGKLNNVREALAIARTCRTILGANGISGEYPVLRHANNLESVLTYEGTSEIHQLVIGQKLTGLTAFS